MFFCAHTAELLQRLIFEDQIAVLAHSLGHQAKKTPHYENVAWPACKTLARGDIFLETITTTPTLGPAAATRTIRVLYL